MQINKENTGMHGILVIDKPKDFTSFDVVAKLRGIFKTKKIGHSGTLDPMATGVLPIFIGNATKAIDMQLNADKEYLATIQFGVKTDTGDITGEVLEQSEKTVTEKELKETLPHFLGKQSQIPPMYSAVKINGTPLYKFARKGQEVERKPREIVIHEVKYKGKAEHNQFVISVLCSKGTYIRTLVEAIGAAVQCPATLAALRRTKAGEYTLEQAITIKDLQEAKEQGELQAMLKPVSSVFLTYPKVQIDGEMIKALRNGIKLPTTENDGCYAIWQGDTFFGVVDVKDKILRVRKLFLSNETN